MTTIVGIGAEKGQKGIILASDCIGTKKGWNSKVDVAVRDQITTGVRKIYIDDRRDIAIGSAGPFDGHYRRFLGEVISGEIDIRKSIKVKGIKEFKAMNEGRWVKGYPEMDYNELLIATKFDGKPRLFRCVPLGNLIEMHDDAIGSGSEYALNYLHRPSDELMIPSRISIGYGIDSAVGALDAASQDTYTGGLDLLVVGVDEMRQYGQQIRDVIGDARTSALQNIKDNYDNGAKKKRSRRGR